MNILKDVRKRHGLSEFIIFKCSKCSHETKFYASKKLEKGKFEVNTRSVCNSMKGGRKLLSGFCAMMNLPLPLASASYGRQLTSTANVASSEAEKQMNDAANCIRQKILSKKPDAVKEDEDGAIPVAVSIDGTWQELGYSSKYGVVVTSLLTPSQLSAAKCKYSLLFQKLFAYLSLVLAQKLLY